MNKTKPQCLKCRHYFATYDPVSPRGCKAYQFRSQLMPSQVVKRETGSDCIQFALRQKSASASQQDKLKNLNDPKLW